MAFRSTRVAAACAWWLAPFVLLAGCGTGLNPVVIREPRPEPVRLAMGVYYHDALRSFRYVRIRDPRGGQADAPFRVGDASVRLFDDALGLLFERVVTVSSMAPGDAIDGGPAAVIEPRIVSATQQTGGGGPNTTSARTTIVYELRLYSTGGQPLATWTVTGPGAATSGTSPVEMATWNVNQRSIELAMRDAAWNFTTGFRDVPDVRRWLEQRGVR